MNLIKIATKRTLMNTSSQVNWLAKKLAVLNNSWYFPLIFCPSVLYTVPSEANSYKEPEDKDSNVYELMLNLYSLVRKMSNCWGKYRLTKTMMDISWISSMVFMKKCLNPVTIAMNRDTKSAKPMKEAIVALLL